MKRIKSYKEYQDWVKDIRHCSALSVLHPLFRGHALDSYKLLPTICRDDSFTQDQILKFENELLKNFKRKICNGFIGSVKLHLPKKWRHKVFNWFCSNKTHHLFDWFCLYQARHLEVPTRLLDWTMDDKVALYFAISDVSKHGQDGHVWYYGSSMKNFENLNSIEILKQRWQDQYIHLNAGMHSRALIDRINPFNPSRITLLHNSYFPDAFRLQVAERRRAIQKGKFIVSPNNLIKVPLNKNHIGLLMEKVIIDGNSKFQILRDLKSNFRITDEVLLPDIPEDTQKIITKIINKAKKTAGV